MPEVERQGLDRPRPGELRRRGTEAPKVSFWKKRLELAEQRLNKAGGDVSGGGKWESLIRFFEGEQWGSKLPNPRSWHKITANLCKSNIDAIRPQLYFQDPRVVIEVSNRNLAPQDIPETGPDGMPVVNPQTGMPVIRIRAGTPVALIGGQLVDARQQADLLQAIDNYHIKETIHLKKKVKKVINDACVLPYGVLKLHWQYTTEPVEGPGMDPETGVATPIEKIERVVSDQPCLSRIKPWQFLFDEELDEFDMDQARWVAEIKFLSKEDLKRDPFLDFRDSDIGEGKYHVEGYDEEEASGLSEIDKGAFSRYKVYEIHDLENQWLYVWVEGSSKFARAEMNPYRDVVGSVYSVLGFDETIDSPFPLPLPDQIRSKAEAYNVLRSYQVNHAQRANRRYGVAQGAWADEAEREKWEIGADGVTVTVQDERFIPKVIDHAPVPQDVYMVADVLKKEITEDVGVTAYGRGTREPGVDTAYEAGQIQAGADIKIQEKRDAVREFVRQILRKLNMLLKLFADQEHVVKITGTQGERWVKWTKDDIRGEFFEDVDIYAGMPYAELENKKQAMEMFSLIQQDPFVDPWKVRDTLFRAMKWPEDLLISREQYLMQQQQQQQMMMMQQQQAANQANQSRTIRPTEGDVRRGPDMRADITGSARR